MAGLQTEQLAEKTYEDLGFRVWGERRFAGPLTLQGFVSGLRAEGVEVRFQGVVFFGFRVEGCELYMWSTAALHGAVQ